MELALWLIGFFVVTLATVALIGAIAAAFYVAVPVALRRYRKGEDFERAEHDYVSVIDEARITADITKIFENNVVSAKDRLVNIAKEARQ